MGGGSQQPSGTLSRVQTGAYKQKANADAQLAKVKAAGFDTYMVQACLLYTSTKTGKNAAGTKVQVMVEQPKFYYKVVPMVLEKANLRIGKTKN